MSTETERSTGLRLDDLIDALEKLRETVRGDAVVIASTCCDSNVVCAVERAGEGQVFLSAYDQTINQVSGEEQR